MNSDDLPLPALGHECTTTPDDCQNFRRLVEQGFREAPPRAESNLAVDSPSIIRRESIEAFKCVLYWSVRKSANVRLDQVLARAATTLKHEEEHAFAVRAIRQRVIQYGVELTNDRSKKDGMAEQFRDCNGFMEWDTEPVKDDPLILSLIALYPEEPSDGDLLHAAAIGYDLDRVCAEVDARNAARPAGADPLPYPMSRAGGQ